MKNMEIDMNRVKTLIMKKKQVIEEYQRLLNQQKKTKLYKDMLEIRSTIKSINKELAETERDIYDANKEEFLKEQKEDKNIKRSKNESEEEYAENSENEIESDSDSEINIVHELEQQKKKKKIGNMAKKHVFTGKKK